MKVLLLTVLFGWVALNCAGQPEQKSGLSTVRAVEQYDAVVSQEQGARFRTLQEAVNAAPSDSDRPFVIFIKSGRYRWQQTLIPLPGLHRRLHSWGLNLPRPLPQSGLQCRRGTQAPPQRLQNPR